MFKENLIDALKRRQTTETDDEMSRVMTKIDQQKRLSSKEFLKVYDTLYKQGPAVNFQKTPET
jgi:Ca2+-binding EF-hand superfamily protein